jgi:hypothetical protein
MRTFLKSKKGIVALLATLAVAISAVGAYAYWTTTGAGTGSAANASSNGTIVLHASFAPGLTPGASEPVSFTADNLNSSSLYVGTVSSVVSTSNPGCLAADFTVPAAIENQTIPANTSGVALGTGSTITFADTAVNQDACKGATVTLTLTSN